VQERTLPLAHPVDLRRTLGPLRRGSGDPTTRFAGTALWRATRTPDGPATTLVAVDPRDRSAHARAWGPGATWALDGLPELVGATDDDAPLAELIARRPPGRDRTLLRELRSRLLGMRIPRTRAVAESIVPVILEQKVTGAEARRSYCELVLGLGEPALGPVDGPRLRVPPHPEALATLPYFAFHRYGIERKRAETIRVAARHAARLDALVDVEPAVAREHLARLPGIGPWTAAEVALVALGDPDAVSVGDYHLPHSVGWAFERTVRSDDHRMLELLEPYRGQRGRVLRLVAAGGITAPRFGPRQPLRDFRAS
jgi:3-methyladenine DNA glycosylase/8-oxoguanine DNA glycosylase